MSFNIEWIYYRNIENVPEEFYNEKQEKNIFEWEEKRLYNHRVFNNWVKSVLISETLENYK